MNDILSEIWATARNNKLRTILTGFAVAWGIFMLITLLGAGNGLINGITQQTEGRFNNTMVVYGGTTSQPYNGLKEVLARVSSVDVAEVGTPACILSRQSDGNYQLFFTAQQMDVEIVLSDAAGNLVNRQSYPLMEQSIF